MARTGKEVKSFVLIAFLLLAALFGMMIMTFIFGNLNTITDTTFTTAGNTSVNNETPAFITSTVYTLNATLNETFRGGVVIVAVINTTGTVNINSGNWTVDATKGTIVGSGNQDENFTDVQISYSYDLKREAQVVSENVNNNSLTAIKTYSSQANTQFTTVAIAITLAILIAVFLLFWVAFMGKTTGGGSSSGSFNSGRGGGGRSRTSSSGMDI